MPNVQCHYDVLDVPRDADESTLKKKYRKLILRYHPDKNPGDDEAAAQFLLVQQAYECLSNKSERQWYDEHRDAILRGGRGYGNGGDGSEADEGSFLFDTTPYRFTGCYDGYGDGIGGFYHVYDSVFQSIMEGERNGWISEGNVDETLMSNYHLLSESVSFGNGSTPWKEVSVFYSSWESFSSCLAYASADKYDPRDVESRYQRRRVDEENRKARRTAKRKRNAEIIGLVEFVKEKDPRVEEAKRVAEEEKIEREARRVENIKKKKAEMREAREAWRLEREKEREETEENDLDAGRIRLADLDDSDDEWSRKKGKKGKKGKRGKRKGKKGKRRQWSSDEESEEEKDDDENKEATPSSDQNVEDGDARATNDEKDGANLSQASHGEKHETVPIPDQDFDDTGESDIKEDGNATYDQTSEKELTDEMILEDIGAFNDESLPMYDTEEDEEESEEDEESEESEEEITWRCVVCRKDFKSDNQLQNHLKSKKHKEQVKKTNKKYCF